VFEQHTVCENLELAMKMDKRVRPTLFARLTSEQDGRIAAIVRQIRLNGAEHRLAGLLSHGQKQWLEIGMLLMQDPEIIMLDEPVAGMSVRERTETALLIRAISKDRSVIVIEHDMEFVREIADRVTVMHLGKILAEGSMEKVSQDPKVIEVYIGH
jgi:urea transport system ATP-binding protein